METVQVIQADRADRLGCENPRTVKKGCAGVFLVWAACVAAYARVAWNEIHELAPSMIIGVLGGTFAAMLVGAIVGLFRGSGDRGALARAKRGDPPKDGRLEAASGAIRPLGAPLEAPLTGRPCVLYEYTVKSTMGGAAEYAGIAMTPSVIESARGPQRVLGWPSLELGVPGSPQFDRAHGQAYVERTSFEELKVTKLIGMFTDSLADDDGQIRRDLRSSGATPTLHQKILDEKIVAPGEVVTLLGRWSDAKGGFTSGGSAILNRIYVAPLDVVAKRQAADPWKQLLVALFFFTVLHAILVPIYLTRHGGFTNPLRRERASAWDDGGDCNRAKELLDKGADPNERHDGQTLLMRAARERRLACTEALLAKGARVDDVDPRGDTAFVQAVMAGHEDIAAALKKAGSKDFRITAELGRPVTESSASFAVVKRYLAAVHAADLDTMASLLSTTSRFALEHEKENLSTWQEFRPKDPHLVDGFETAVSATITVQGQAAVGSGRVSFDVEKSMDGWKIAREWFPN
jgi:hypothetical protein